MPKPTKGGFYAVSEGRKPGVYLTWEECEAQVKGYPKPKYKKFTNAAEAEGFVKGFVVPAPSASNILEKPSLRLTETSSTYDKGKKRAISPDLEDESGWDVVYSDGACKGNGKADPIAGVGVWWGVDDPRNIAERCPGDQTNNRAELIAILRILETTPRTKKPLLIKSDSQYSIKCFRDWLPNWRKNGWKKSDGESIKNGDIIRYLSAHLDARARFGQKIRLQYVKGHSGEQGNDGADAQANLGALLPAQSERDWKKLERDLLKRVDEEWKDKEVKPVETPTEVEETIAELPDESPLKVRKIGREIRSQQPLQYVPESPVASVSPIPTTETTGQLSTSLTLTPRDSGSLRKMSTFKPAGIASSSSQRHGAAPAAKSNPVNPPTLVKATFIPKQIKQTNTPPLSPQYSYEYQTPSRSSQGISFQHTKSLRNPVAPVKLNTARIPVPPLGNAQQVVGGEHPVTPIKSIKAAQVQVAPSSVAEAEQSRHTLVHSRMPSVVVNEEDIDFTMFEDCTIDDEDMWKDLWP